MKNMISRFVMAAVIFLVGVTASAQQQAGIKPKTDDGNKKTVQENTQPVTPVAAPAVPLKQIERSAEQEKPILPGSEIKPVETDKLVVPGNKKQETENNYQPILIPVSKTAVPAPVTKELNPGAATQQKPKAVVQSIKEQ